MSREAEVLHAAADLVAAFASNDTARYFECFSAQASFVFHTLAAPLNTRAEYEALWQQWQAEGFAVLGCESSNGRVSVQGDAAVFVHDVATHIRLAGEEHHLQERETIVFRQEGRRWLAWHEHLSVVSPS